MVPEEASPSIAGPWWKRQNRFKQHLREGGTALAAWITIPWPPLVGILAQHGVGAALIDLEHSSLSIKDVEQFVISAEASGVTPIVRPRSIDPAEVSLLLDVGTQGLVFPHVDDAPTAELAMSCSRYPPGGRRGWAGGHSRYDNWQGMGSGGSASVFTAEYVQRAEENVFNALLIETVSAVENIEQILEVPGIDAVLFGRGDYSVETGFSRQAADAAELAVFNAARRRGIGMGLSFNHSSSVSMHAGCFMHIGDDAVILHEAIARQAAIAKESRDRDLAAAPRPVARAADKFD